MSTGKKEKKEKTLAIWQRDNWKEQETKRESYRHRTRVWLSLFFPVCFFFGSPLQEEKGTGLQVT